MAVNSKAGALPSGPAGRSSARGSIYAHRAVRSLPTSPLRLGVALGLAVVLTALIAIYAVPLMQAHARVVNELMIWAGVPNSGWEPVGIFRGLQPALAPRTEIPSFLAVSESARLLLILSVVALLILSQRYLLTRNLAHFLIVLLFFSAIFNALYPSYQFNSRTFTQIWLRSEMLVWLLLPWVSVLLFIVPLPDWREGIAWVLFVQLYAFFFSALRMTFCLGVLHHTGLLFFPPLWFGMGTLADLLFLLFFYSICVYRASGRIWGRRASWKLLS